MKNATIISTLEGLLNFMDARVSVDIFRQFSDGGQELLRGNKIYNIISDPEFIGKYGSYKVIGLSVTLGGVSILIEEA